MCDRIHAFLKLLLLISLYATNDKSIITIWDIRSSDVKVIPILCLSIRKCHRTYKCSITYLHWYDNCLWFVNKRNMADEWSYCRIDYFSACSMVWSLWPETILIVKRLVWSISTNRSICPLRNQTHSLKWSIFYKTYSFHVFRFFMNYNSLYRYFCLQQV